MKYWAFLGDEYFAEKSTDECIPLILKRENSTIYSIYIYSDRGAD